MALHVHYMVSLPPLALPLDVCTSTSILFCTPQRQYQQGFLIGQEAHRICESHRHITTRLNFVDDKGY